MRDVAERAGVSTATVSRVLNGSPTVQEDYRIRVSEAIAELGYRPNRLARNLRRQNAEMIGVVVSDIENPHFTSMVRAVEDAAFRRGYRLLLCNTDEEADKQRAYLEMLAGERVLGVILSPSNPAAEEIRELLDLGIPVVAFDRTVTDPRADSVVSDGTAAARAATEHLLASGRERVGFISGPARVETGAARRAGYEAAMRTAGREPLVVDGRFRIEGGQRAAEGLLAGEFGRMVGPASSGGPAAGRFGAAGPSEPAGEAGAPGSSAPATAGGGPLSGLVVANNLMAIGALKALAEAGRRVPEDVAVVALDDPFWAELVQPPLTVLAQPVRRMADAAMRLLLERIGGRRARPRHEVFRFELRVRGSCGMADRARKGR